MCRSTVYVLHMHDSLYLRAVGHLLPMENGGFLDLVPALMSLSTAIHFLAKNRCLCVKKKYNLSFRVYNKKKIFNGCLMQIENSVTQRFSITW